MPALTTHAHLSPLDHGEVMALATRVLEVDGVFPLNEEATLGPAHATHVLARDGADLVGYGVRMPDSSAQILVDPSHRRRGVGWSILCQIGLDASVWAFGNLECAQSFCTSRGLAPVRELLVMETSVTESDSRRPRPATPTRPPADPAITISAYRPDDLIDLVELNARAFASHPDQGRLGVGDFQARMASPWFDPAGLLIARDAAGAMAGFHWTKMEGRDAEVYVLGVDPGHGGAGIGRLLLTAGVDHLRAHGATVIRLWVEGDNVRAKSLYEASGFSVVRRDLQYRKVDTATAVFEADRGRQE
ncbi:MAG: mycothiol synthase [Propionibacteriaceae bacterium]|nr:mycothiol synthase [Propionibacteriaceae bacterium]